MSTRSDRHGGRNDAATAARSVLFACGRMVGFALFAGLGLAILAAIVLLPAYRRTCRARYQRDRAAARVARLEAEASTKARLAQALPHDRTLTVQLMAVQAGRLPAEERILAASAPRPQTLEQMIRLPEPAPPAPPDGPLIAAAGRLANPATRRGLFFIAAVSLTAAFLLFAPPSCRQDGQDD